MRLQVFPVILSVAKDPDVLHTAHTCNPFLPVFPMLSPKIRPATKNFRLKSKLP